MRRIWAISVTAVRSWGTILFLQLHIVSLLFSTFRSNTPFPESTSSPYIGARLNATTASSTKYVKVLIPRMPRRLFTDRSTPLRLLSNRNYPFSAISRILSTQTTAANEFCSILSIVKCNDRRSWVRGVLKGSCMVYR